MKNKVARLSFPIILAAALHAAALGQTASAFEKPVVIEPDELHLRDDLVGHRVAVDDRITIFRYDPEEGFNRLVLKRCRILFHLPKMLRPERQPGKPAAIVRGTLRRGPEGLYVDVDELEFMPNDRARLDRGVSVLSKADADARMAWAAWADRRGKAFGDETLRKHARELVAESVAAEADRLSVDPVPRWLALAARVRAWKLPDEQARALGHRAFRLKLDAARSAQDLRTLAAEVAEFFPGVEKAANADARLDPKVETLYNKQPGPVYLSETAVARAALDRRLWSDVVKKRIGVEVAANPARKLDYADEAAAIIPDRPEVAAQLREQTLREAELRAGLLRLVEIEQLADYCRNTLHDPNRGRRLIRLWLDDQRLKKLGATDAEGRVALAEQYDSLVNDSDTAVALLQEAWRIDPKSKQIAEAFRRRGYRRQGNAWLEPLPQSADAVAPKSNSQTAAAMLNPNTHNTLRGATPAEVRSRFGGKPDHVIRSAARGEFVEQWIYLSTRDTQYITFSRLAGDAKPRVQSYYTRPRNPELNATER